MQKAKPKVTRRRCAAQNCGNYSQRSGTEKIYYYPIPYDKSELLEEWRTNVKKNFIEGEDNFLCSLHFSPCQFSGFEPSGARLKPKLILGAKPFLIQDDFGGAKGAINNDLQSDLSSVPALAEDQPLPLPDRAVETRSNKGKRKSSHGETVRSDDQLQLFKYAAKANPIGLLASSTPEKDFHPLSLIVPVELSPISPFVKTHSRKRTLVEEFDDSDDELASPLKSVRSEMSWQPSESMEEEIAAQEEEDSAAECIDDDDLSNGCTNACADINYVLTDVTKIEQLLRNCKNCGEMNAVTKSRRGAAMTFNCICSNGHTFSWSTSKIEKKKPLINTFVAAALLVSGVAFLAADRFANAIGLAFISEKTFYTHLKDYCYPVIKRTWLDMRRNILDSIKNSNLARVITGDGRFDSPGHCAKFCLYSLMDSGTNLIVDFVVWYKGWEPGEMEGKSFKYLFKRFLDDVGWDKVKTFCSDRSLTVSSYMKKDFNCINHAYDIWHLAKSLMKALGKLALKRPAIGLWKQSIVNHLWWCTANCDENVDKLFALWRSMLNHVRGIHEWTDPKGEQQRCQHAQMSDENQENTDWIDKKDDLTTLEKAAFSTRFMNQLRHCIWFVHTGALESYHNLCLVYAPKRIGYGYEGFVVRTILAALDHNHNVGRTVVSDSVQYKKATKSFKLVNHYEKKDQEWRRALVLQCVDYARFNKCFVFSEEEILVLQPFPVPKTLATEEKPCLEDMRNARDKFRRMK